MMGNNVIATFILFDVASVIVILSSFLFKKIYFYSTIFSMLKENLLKTQIVSTTCITHSVGK